MNKFKKLLILFVIYGLAYLDMEIIFRAFRGPLIGKLDNISYWSFASWTTLWMFPIGAFIGLALGYLNGNKKLNKIQNWIKILISVCIIYIVEFTTGMIVNVWLGLGAWDYSELPGNLMGQISIVYLPVWILASPMAFWIYDVVMFYLFDAEKPKPFIKYYSFK